MRKALVASSLLALLLGGCASNPADRDVSGTWINQVAIDAAAKGGPLREALQSFGPNLEWEVNTKAWQARYYNGFEVAEGKLLGEKSGAWSVDFYGSSATELKRKGKQLLQVANDNEPEQLFARPKEPAPEGAPLGANFERALYAAYMGVTGRSSTASEAAPSCNSRPTARSPACRMSISTRCAWRVIARP